VGGFGQQIFTDLTALIDFVFVDLGYEISANLSNVSGCAGQVSS